MINDPVATARGSETPRRGTSRPLRLNFLNDFETSFNMNTTKELRVVIILVLSCIAVLVYGCRPRSSANEKRYPINGKVVAVDKKDRTATIEHEDIVGYMPAMTMPFRIKN